MKVSIIKVDGLVSKDGVGQDGLSLSSIPSDVWAVQWDTTTSKGTVEKTDLTVEEITDFTPYESALTEYDAAYVAIPAMTAEELMRAERTRRLEECDYLGLSDVTMSNAWKTYRQALRALPANTSDFSNPNWPTIPE